MADYLQLTLSLDMWSALLGLAAIIKKLFDFIEQSHNQKRQAQEAKTRAKAENYDNLQRALKARKSARQRINAGGLPDDKYRRDG